MYVQLFKCFELLFGFTITSTFLFIQATFITPSTYSFYIILVPKCWTISVHEVYKVVTSTLWATEYITILW